MICQWKGRKIYYFGGIHLVSERDVKIEFRLIISAIIPDEVDSPEDAIESSYDSDYNSVFYLIQNGIELPIAPDWPYEETGSSTTTLNSWHLTLILVMEWNHSNVDMITHGE